MLILRKEVNCDVDLLKFMYPDFILVDDGEVPTFPDRPAIFIGSRDKETFIKAYKQTSLDYIVVSKAAIINLYDRRQLVQVGFEKWNRFVPKYLVGSGKEDRRGKGINMGIIDDLDDEDFMWAFKHHWVTGKWVIKSLPDQNTFLELISVINSSKLDFIKRFFEVVNDTRPYRIESSIMTFLLRVKYKNYKGLKSRQYAGVISMFEGKYLERSIEAINNSLVSSVDNFTLRLLCLLMCIIDSNR